MRLRMLTAAVLAVLACAGLTGCRTKVGLAAMADGKRITESQVNGYLTPNAQPIQQQTASGGTISVAPRTYVLQTIISTRLFVKILTELQRHAPDEQAVQASIDKLLAGDSPQHFVSSRGFVGYTAAFAKLVLRGSVLVDQIRTIANNGVDIQPVLSKLKFPVSVNPRYGAWDPKSYTMSVDPYAGLPSALLRPKSATSAGQ